MSTLMIYFWLYSICFLWSVGTWFAWMINDEELQRRDMGRTEPSAKLTAAVLISVVSSLFLIGGLGITYVATDGAKFGWSLKGWR